jgi:hypothetical protein
MPNEDFGMVKARGQRRQQRKDPSGTPVCIVTSITAGKIDETVIRIGFEVMPPRRDKRERRLLAAPGLGGGRLSRRPIEEGLEGAPKRKHNGATEAELIDLTCSPGSRGLRPLEPSIAREIIRRPRSTAPFPPLKRAGS